jgi:hypothetical protein
MNLKDSYLVLYNSLCCAGWALIWLHAVGTLAVGLGSSKLAVGALMEALASVYGGGTETGGLAMETLLWYTQGAALMEIVHALLRLVRSPVVVTVMQVMSRIVALVAVVYAPSAQSK